MARSDIASEYIVRAIEANRSELHGYLSHRTGCMETAADLFQSIVERLLLRDPDPPIQNVRAYLFQAARHALANHYRTQDRLYRFEHGAAAQATEQDERSPERVLAAQETLAQLEAALAELPVLTRRMFLLYRLHGVKQEEIARRFDVHVSTVEKRIRSAVFHCRSRLEDA